jgi:hypothetical protein
LAEGELLPEEKELQELHVGTGEGGGPIIGLDDIYDDDYGEPREPSKTQKRKWKRPAEVKMVSNYDPHLKAKVVDPNSEDFFGTPSSAAKPPPSSVPPTPKEYKHASDKIFEEEELPAGWIDKGSEIIDYRTMDQ